MANALTTGQAADLLGVSSATVRRWVGDGQIPGFRTPGGHFRIPRHVVRERAHGQSGGPMNKNRALLYVRARQEDEDLANMALVHLSNWALDQEYQVSKVIREVGLGTDQARPKLEEVRQAVTKGEIDIIIVERRDRILLMGSEAFARWAKDHGVIVEEAGVSSDRAEQAYAAEILEDVFYPLTDALALVVDDRDQAEQAAARAMSEVASFLGI